MKLSLSLLWRIAIVQGLFMLVARISLPREPLFTDISMLQWTVPFLYLGFAALLLCFQIIRKQSLIYLIFGARLKLSQVFWKKLSFALVGYCVIVATADVIVAQVASFEMWNQFKLLAPLVTLLSLVFIFPQLSSNKND